MHSTEPARLSRNASVSTACTEATGSNTLKCVEPFAHSTLVQPITFAAWGCALRAGACVSMAQARSNPPWMMKRQLARPASQDAPARRLTPVAATMVQNDARPSSIYTHSGPLCWPPQTASLHTCQHRLTAVQRIQQPHDLPSRTRAVPGAPCTRPAPHCALWQAPQPSDT